MPHLLLVRREPKTGDVSNLTNTDPALKSLLVVLEGEPIMPYVKHPPWASELLGTSQQMLDFVRGVRIRNEVGEQEFERRVRIADAKEAAKHHPSDGPPEQKR